jgi:formylglycine-generating enzyme required for sulfatase activity
VVNISWGEAVEFADQMSIADSSASYRLPTEAEWEYSCRCATGGGWQGADDPDMVSRWAWFAGNTWDVGEPYPHEVGTLEESPCGLHDIAGNVWEIVSDNFGPYSSSAEVDPLGPESDPLGHVVRGGSFGVGVGSVGDACRTRTAFFPSHFAFDVGLRLVRIPDRATATDSRTWGETKREVGRSEN